MSSETVKNVSEIITVASGGGWFVSEHSDVFHRVTLDREQHTIISISRRCWYFSEFDLKPVSVVFHRHRLIEPKICIRTIFEATANYMDMQIVHLKPGFSEGVVNFFLLCVVFLRAFLYLPARAVSPLHLHCALDLFHEKEVHTLRAIHFAVLHFSEFTAHISITYIIPLCAGWALSYVCWCALLLLLFFIRIHRIPFYFVFESVCTTRKTVCFCHHLNICLRIPFWPHFIAMIHATTHCENIKKKRTMCEHISEIVFYFTC